MSDEISPDAPPEPPAVAEDNGIRALAEDAGYTPAETEEVVKAFTELGTPPDPVFDDSAPLPYAAGTAEPFNVEQQILAQIQMLNIKVDSLTGRVDWIAPRVEWIRSTFDALIQQFGKLSPGQVFSMLRGKGGMPPVPGQQEGTTKS